MSGQQRHGETIPQAGHRAGWQSGIWCLTSFAAQNTSSVSRLPDPEACRGGAGQPFQQVRSRRACRVHMHML